MGIKSNATKENADKSIIASGLKNKKHVVE